MKDTFTKVGSKSAFRDHVDISTQQGYEVDLELRVVKETPAKFKVHKDVDVTVRACLSPGHGSENADVAGTMTLSNGEDLVAGLQKCVNIHWP